MNICNGIVPCHLDSFRGHASYAKFMLAVYILVRNIIEYPDVFPSFFQILGQYSYSLFGTSNDIMANKAFIN